VSAFDDVDRQTASRGFLVLGLHIGTGFAHRLDDLVQADVMTAVTMKRDPSGTNRLDRADGISFDAEPFAPARFSTTTVVPRCRAT